MPVIQFRSKNQKAPVNYDIAVSDYFTGVEVRISGIADDEGSRHAAAFALNEAYLAVHRTLTIDRPAPRGWDDAANAR
jgi:hypothetical protein